VHQSANLNMQRELQEIGGYIARLKGEIGALRPNELHRVHIPAAGNELSAVVQTTEVATNSIMERAEAVLTVQLTDHAAYRAFVNARMVAVIEACSFQDLTGQRVARVVETLGQIEKRLARFAAATRIADMETVSEHERANNGRKSRLMLTGPASCGEGHSQAEVDFVLDSRRPTVTQDEIDKLFA
jgi:chemotaxis protein CheZ